MEREIIMSNTGYMEERKNICDICKCCGNFKRVNEDGVCFDCLEDARLWQ